MSELVPFDLYDKLFAELSDELSGLNFEEEQIEQSEAEIKRIHAARAKRAAELATQRLREEILYAQNEITSWQQTPLDEINPPPLEEKALPFLAGAAFLSAIASRGERRDSPSLLTLLGAILAAIYVVVRLKRRDHAKRRMQVIVERWQADLQQMQQQLAQRISDW